MAKLTPEEAQSMAALFSKMRGDSEAAQANLERMLASQGRGVQKLEKQFKKLRVANIKEIRKAEAAVKSLVENWEEATDAERKQLPVLNKTITEYKKANAGIFKLAEGQEEARKNTSGFTESLSRAMAPLRRYISLTGALSGIVETLVEVYRNWWRLQGLTREALGQATRQIGGTERQMQAFQARAEAMRGTFGNLEGAVDGIALSYQQMQEITLALRESSDSMAVGLEHSIFRMARGLAGGTDNAVQLFRILETGVAGANTDLDEFGARMMDFSADIGANAGQLTRDFIEARAAVARFGTDGEQVFRDAAMMANEFGFETRRIFDMMRGFDTFSQASSNVNQLNAMLGTTLSSYELMMETNPAERLEMIRQQILQSGQDWDAMGYHARQAIAQMTGESEDTLSRIFREGLSLDQLRSQQRQQEAERQQRQQNQESAQERMANLVNRTAVILDSWQRSFENIRNIVSEALSPIFNVIHEQTEGIWNDLQGWFSSLQGAEPASTWIQNVADWLNDMFMTVRSYDWKALWERTVQLWREWQPAIAQAGEWIQRIIEWVRNPSNWERIWKDAKTTWNEWWPVVQTVGSYIMNFIKFVRSAASVMSDLWETSGINQFINAAGRAINLVRSIPGIGGGEAEGGPAAPQRTPTARTAPSTFSQLAVAASNPISAFGAIAGGVAQLFGGNETAATPRAPTVIPQPSAIQAAPATQKTAETTPAPARGTSVEFRRLPIVIEMNGREFGRGQVEAALRTT